MPVNPGLEPLLAKGWAKPGGHPLGRLDGASLGPYLLVVLLGPKSNVGSRYFHLLLADVRGRLSRKPLALGLHNAGPYPAYNWIELVRYDARPDLDGETVDLAAQGLDLPLFEMLSALLPPGGHLMVEYESPSQAESERVITLGYPPVASPLGYLLFRAGCRSFRDWYISEGGREGPRKLQAFKPLDVETAREREEGLRAALQELLSRTDAGQHGEAGATARRLAARVLAELGGRPEQ